MSSNAARKQDNVRQLEVQAAGTTRYQEGWRAGKPVEDPEKLKRWGYVSAKPSEYLVCVRRGRIDRKSSGQGARVFKWPWTSVSVIPTTLQRVEFVADQVTRERIGVRVTGIAVYRIAVPEIAYRMLNFSYAERASEKLDDTLREMFIGAARRLIANLDLEACLSKRKEAIAKFLMEEIAPVVTGRGAPEDVTECGWGVVIDTIEIQDVQVQSAKVFNDLQASYRATLRARAEEAELQRERLVAEKRAETEQQIALAQIESARQTRLLRARAEAEAAETEAAEQLRAAQAQARVKEDEQRRDEAQRLRDIEIQQGLAVREAERQTAVERQARAMERERELAQIGLDEERRRSLAEAEEKALAAEQALAANKHAAAKDRLAQEREQAAFGLDTEVYLKGRRVKVELELRRQEAEVGRFENGCLQEHERAQAEVEQLLNQGRALRDLVNEGLPRMAEAFRQSYGTVNLTQLGGEAGGPASGVAQAFAQLLAVARSFGLDPSRLMPKEPEASAADPDASQP